MRIERTQTEAGLSALDITARMQEWKDRLDRSGLFTRVLQVFDEGIDPDAAETRDDRFEFGLNCLLDGIAPLMS